MHRRVTVCLVVLVAGLLHAGCGDGAASKGPDAAEGFEEADSGPRSPEGVLLPPSRRDDNDAAAGAPDGADASTRDASLGSTDAGLTDGGEQADAAQDAGAADSGTTDSGTTDSGTTDSGPADSSLPTCELDRTRCASGARERCDGTAWVSAACPLDQPACVAGECVLRGPAMVSVGSYFVDSTEVTVAQYREFLTDTDGDTSEQPAACSWNSTYAPDAQAGPDNWPVTSVDWCDARAYCSWAGKRLCGAIAGGALPLTDVLDESVSQWFLACGGPNGNTHPNASSDCNSTGGNGLADVASHPDCEGFYSGLFDLEGNAAEWIDSCEANSGADDVCALLGGSHIDNISYCTESFEYSRDTTATPFGFRCCSG